MLMSKTTQIMIDAKLKLFNRKPAPINRTATYIGCLNHLYIPETISAAPGFGIGEIRKEGFKATYAAIKMAMAHMVKKVEMPRKYLASLSGVPAGLRNRSPKSPNWSPTNILAFKITSFQTFC